MLSNLPRSLLKRCAAITAVLAFAASGMTFAAGTVKLGSNIWIGFAPFYVADQLDLYKKYNTQGAT